MRAVIVDDESKSREVLKALLEMFCEGVEVVGEAGGIPDGIQVIQAMKPELVFLDISLKEGDSFSLLEQLDKIDFQVIFITAFDEWSVKALNYSGLPCLFKPLDAELLSAAVEKVVLSSHREVNEAFNEVKTILKSKFERVPVISGEGFHALDIKEILQVTAEGEGSMIETRKQEKIKSSKSFDNFKSILLDKGFKQDGRRLYRVGEG